LDTDKYGGNEKVLDVSQLLLQCDDLDEDFLEDDADDLPVWEHEHRVKALPFTEEELVEREQFLARQQQQRQELQQQVEANTLPDPLEPEPDVVSAYTAAQGFREMSVQDLSVALTAGGLVDLVLDVRSHDEFAAGNTIPTAVNIPLNMLSDAVRAGQLDPYHTSSIAVVCASGQRSAQATVRLSKVFGFRNVSNVSGGMAAWQSMKAGLSASGGCGCGNGGNGGCSK
jgi:rhodanese-related sulfurtransferase